MDYNTCCYPQSWWGWWQWTQYWAGKQICEINCGNCICTGSGAAPRGFADMSTGTEIVRAPAGEKDCHCDHNFVQRLHDFVNHNNRMRRERHEQ